MPAGEPIVAPGEPLPHPAETTPADEGLNGSAPSTPIPPAPTLPETSELEPEPPFDVEPQVEMEAPAEAEPIPGDVDESTPFDLLPGDETVPPAESSGAEEPVNPTGFTKTTSGPGAGERSTSAVERFRRAVHTVRITEASPVP
jgi:hypothetical protein